MLQLYKIIKSGAMHKVVSVSGNVAFASISMVRCKDFLENNQEYYDSVTKRKIDATDTAL
jgi:hypothetical protein